jgi:hypothetical protein
MSDVLSHHEDGNLKVEPQFDHLERRSVSVSHHVSNELSILFYCTIIIVADRNSL